MLTWLKDNASVIGALAAALVAFVAVLQFVVVDPINARFDAQDKRLDLLTNEVSELRRLTVSIIERVSRNEGQIDFLREQFQTVDAPSP